MTRNNNFNLIRICCALLVLIGHSYKLLGRPGDPFGEANGFVDLGGLAVKTFFVLSGYLLSESLLRDPRMGRLWISRFLRIMPAYVVMIFAMVFVIGPLATSDSWYWSRLPPGTSWPR